MGFPSSGVAGARDNPSPSKNVILESQIRTAALPALSSAKTHGAALPVGQIMCFRLGAQEYAVDVDHVQELRPFEQPTTVLDAEPGALGVINLRGEMVPVVAVRQLLGMAPVAAFGAAAATIVVRVGGRAVGWAIDEVMEVFQPAPDQVRAVPGLGAGVDSRSIRCLVSIERRTVALLDAVYLTRTALDAR